ncbi:MAG: sulfoxide reductase heme-binding subunit YedZ, partial [Kordiimonadaceae bacterium]|nr:sulfoxide reductase heme-binding subunit YedZ [Kordiimonadaceae bacterium]
SRLLIHTLSILPALWIGWQIWLWYSFLPHELSANPIEYITDFTGNWTIRFLLLTLSITPLVKLTKWRLLKYRRAIGLYAFLYGLLHFLNYMMLDYFFNWSLIIEDVLKRPAITFGMAGFAMLVILAITSFKFTKIKLGKNWTKLHQLIYILAISVTVHNYMMVKADVLIPLIHATILSILLLYRLYLNWSKRRERAKRQLA